MLPTGWRIDQFGQVIDMLASQKRDLAITRPFFNPTLATTPLTTYEVITDKAAIYPRVLDELVPAAWHHAEQYATDEIVNPSAVDEVGSRSQTHFFRPGGSGLRRRFGAGVIPEAAELVKAGLWSL